MKRVCVAAMLLCLTACGTRPEADEQTARVMTGGSTSMELLMNVLAESYARDTGGTVVTYEPTGSGAGVDGAASGTVDIGLSSRYLKEEEKGRVVETVVALDGLAIIVHRENPVTGLTLEELTAVARGEITCWSELGGPEEALAFIGREGGSGTRTAFEEAVDSVDRCFYHQELTSTGAVVAAVASNPGAVGYASLPSLNEEVRGVAVDGVDCTEETVRSGAYPIQRPFLFLTPRGGEMGEEAAAFFEYATSGEQKGLYTLAGVVAAFG